ncbi:MAG: DUF1330 domain-containing protein [Flavobacteriaceae bacterium]
MAILSRQIKTVKMGKKVYSFGRMKVKDFDEYIERYGLQLEPILAKYNGRVLAANKKGVLVEGKEEGNWTVLMEFDSGKDAFEFYASPEYAPLKKMRLEELTDNALAISFPAEISLE